MVSVTRLQHDFIQCLSRFSGERGRSPLLRMNGEGDHVTLWHRGERLLQVDLEALGQGAVPAQLLRLRHRPITLEVPPGWLLERRLLLPSAARQDLHRVIAYELDRITPFDPERVFFTVEEMGENRDGSRLEAMVRLLPRTRVEPWLEAFRHARIPLARITAPGLKEGVNLLPPALRRGAGLGQRLRRVLPLLLTLGFLASALTYPQWQARSRLEALQWQERELARQARKVLELRQSLEERLDALQQVDKRWRSVPSPLAVLSDLSRLLPEDTHLQQLQVHENQLTLRGLSSEASALIGLLERSPHFSEPHFLSPVTRQGQKELFHLRVHYRSPSPGGEGGGE